MLNPDGSDTAGIGTLPRGVMPALPTTHRLQVPAPALWKRNERFSDSNAGL